MYSQRTKPRVIEAKLPKRITGESISEGLVKAPMDEQVGIRHAIISQGNTWSYHVAEVRGVVTPHVHTRGAEVYYVLSGNGVMHTAKVRRTPTGYTATWTSENRLLIAKGDAFIIPPGHAHSLENMGGEPIIIAFRCPDSHLAEDRHTVTNGPNYVNKPNR